jgi:hypothetical protein
VLDLRGRVPDVRRRGLPGGLDLPADPLREPVDQRRRLQLLRTRCPVLRTGRRHLPGGSGVHAEHGGLRLLLIAAIPNAQAQVAGCLRAIVHGKRDGAEDISYTSEAKAS